MWKGKGRSEVNYLNYLLHHGPSLYQGLCLRLRSHGVAQMERWHMETYPANGKSRLSSPLRLAFPTSKQESRLLQGKISNSHRFRSLLGFLIAWEGLSCLSTACWPAHSGFNWRSWAQIGEVGNCLRPTSKSYHAPGSLAPEMIRLKTASNMKQSFDISILPIKLSFVWIPKQVTGRVITVMADGTSKLCGNCCQCWTLAHCWCLLEETRSWWLSFSSSDEGGSSKALGSMS